MLALCQARASSIESAGYFHFELNSSELSVNLNDTLV